MTLLAPIHDRHPRLASPSAPGPMAGSDGRATGRATDPDGRATDPGRSAGPALPASRPGARRHGTGFWLVGLAFLTAMAFATVPTPLYPLYQARDGFSTFMVTVVFAVFAMGVVVSLLLAGHVSDWVGRKRILIPGLLLEVVAAVLFLVDSSLPTLIVARFVTGLGVGLISATATAHLHELHVAHRPEASPRRFEIVSTVANLGGLGVGPLVAGILAQHLSAPLRLPYLVLGVLLLASVVAVALTPETVQRPPVRPTYRPQRISAGHGHRTDYLAAVTAGFAAFAVFGLFTSLAPGFVSGTLHQPDRTLAGLIVFGVFGGATLAQTLTGRLSPGLRMWIGLPAQAAGLVVLAVGMRSASLAGFLTGGVLAGMGAGVLFKSAIGTVAARAGAGQRGEALAGLFLISYLGLIVPAVGIGVATRYVAATTAMAWFTGALLVVLAVVGGLSRRPAPVAGVRPATR